jgi:hypothetical protein
VPERVTSTGGASLANEGRREYAVAQLFGFGRVCEREGRESGCCRVVAVSDASEEGSCVIPQERGW